MDIICFGELLIDMVADKTGTLKDSDHFIRRAGGAAGNVAVQIAKLGGKVGFVGKLGNDAFSDYLMELMNTYTVDISRVVRDEARKTTVAFISLDNNHQPHYLFYKNNSASSTIQNSDLDEDYLNKCDIFYFSSTILSGEPTRSTTKSALAYASNATIALDVNLRLTAWNSEQEARKVILEVLEKVNVLKINQDELLFLSQTDCENACFEFFKHYSNLQIIIFTKGNRGSTLFIRDCEPIHIATHDIKCISATGAGDSYMGAFLWGLHYSCIDQIDDYRIIGERANAAAEIVIGREGTLEAMPDLNEIDSFLLKFDKNR